MKKYIIIILLALCTIGAWTQEKERTFQFSFIAPLGTNGMDSHLYTNSFSLNLLGGYSYANTILELGGLYNFNSEYTSGFQGAGLLNYTGRSENVFQFAGLANLSLSGNSRLQLSGLLNVGAGITGLQGAGAMNVASSVSGLQVAGTVNLADTITGVQGAPVLNVATNVKGVQIGLINYAEEIDGVQIGLINVVANGGKQELEISSSEFLQGIVSFKLGIDPLYTIFSSGAYFLNYDFEYAAGLGIGTQFNWNNGWGNQIEGMFYSISRDAELDFISHSISQVKLLTSRTLIGGLNIFAGPTFNVEVISKNKHDGSFNKSIAPWVMWDEKFSSTHLNMWVGFSAGLTYRF